MKIQMSAVATVKNDMGEAEITPDRQTFDSYGDAIAALERWSVSGFWPAAKGARISSMTVFFTEVDG